MSSESIETERRVYEWLERSGRNADGDRTHVFDYVRVLDSRIMGAVLCPSGDAGAYEVEFYPDALLYDDGRSYLDLKEAKGHVESTARKQEQIEQWQAESWRKRLRKERRRQRVRKFFGLRE